MAKELIVQFTCTSDRKPLAIVRNLPGLDAEMTPARMRSLAIALYGAARLCEAQPISKKNTFHVGATKTFILAE